MQPQGASTISTCLPAWNCFCSTPKQESREILLPGRIYVPADYSFYATRVRLGIWQIPCQVLYGQVQYLSRRRDLSRDRLSQKKQKNNRVERFQHGHSNRTAPRSPPPSQRWKWLAALKQSGPGPGPACNVVNPQIRIQFGAVLSAGHYSAEFRRKTEGNWPWGQRHADGPRGGAISCVAIRVAPAMRSPRGPRSVDVTQ